MINNRFRGSVWIFCATAVVFAAHASAQVTVPNVGNYVTATMDSYFAFYEKGLNPDDPTTGLPHPGITTATGGMNGTFLMQPYTSNNALLLNAQQTTGTLTLATPTPANAFWLTTATGFGPAYLNTVTHFADGTPDFTQNFFFQDDWFHGRPNVFNSAGRIDINQYTYSDGGPTRTPGSFDTGGLQIAVQTVVFPNPAVHPISSIDLSWLDLDVRPAFPTNTAIFGLSVSTGGAAGPFDAVQLTPSSFTQDVVVEDAALPSAGALPEPAGLLGFGLAAILFGRRRNRLASSNTVRSHFAEPLETRLLFNTVFVTDLSDDSAPTGTTLRQAISTAQNGDTIAFANASNLSQGSHTITLNSPIEVTTSFNLQGLGAAIIAVSGNQTGAVFKIDNNAAPTFSGISIVQGGDTVDQFGGAIYIAAGATLNLSSDVLSNNVGGNFGGALANFGTLNVINSAFSGNTSFSGGAIANFGILNISQSSFSNNASDTGGAIYCRPTNVNPVLTIDRTTFLANSTYRDPLSAEGGGAIAGGGTLLLTNSLFSGNTSFSGAGCIEYGGDITIDSCVFSGNSGIVAALTVGENATVTRSTIDSNGATALRASTAAVSTYGNCTILGCTVSNNSTHGISNTGTLNLINSTIARNSDANGIDTGGGIVNTGTLVCRNSTIALNYASAGGGGISNSSSGTVTLFNTIVAGNTQTDSFFHTTVAGDIMGPVTGSFNLIGTGARGGLVNSVNYNMVGVPDAGLTPLGNFGGPTQTMALMPGSLAFNTGYIPYAIDQNGQPLVTDQRGLPRVASSSVDVGAYEANSPQSIPPQNLAAVAGPDQVTLSWNSTGADAAFSIYRGTSPGGEDAITIGNVTTTSFLDATALRGITYYYKVAAVNAFGAGTPSNEASASPIPISPLTSSDGLSAFTLVRDADLVHIDWTAGTHSGQFPAADANPIVINGNPGATEIMLDHSRGTVIPRLLRLNGTIFQFDGDELFTDYNDTIDIGQSIVYFSYNADPISIIQNALLNGFHNGAWNGIAGPSASSIMSSTVAFGSAGAYSIGYADSSDHAISGQPANTIEVRFTLAGDANLDGTVDSNDAAILKANWNATDSPSWDRANFNYDFAVNGTDALLLGRNWNAVAPTGSEEVSSAIPETAPATDPSDSAAPPAVAPIVAVAQPVADSQAAPSTPPAPNSQPPAETSSTHCSPSVVNTEPPATSSNLPTTPISPVSGSAPSTPTASATPNHTSQGTTAAVLTSVAKQVVGPISAAKVSITHSVMAPVTTAIPVIATTRSIAKPTTAALVATSSPALNLPGSQNNEHEPDRDRQSATKTKHHRR